MKTKLWQASYVATWHERTPEKQLRITAPIKQNDPAKIQEKREQMRGI